MGIENVWSALYSTTDRLNTGRMVAWMRELLQCQGYVAGRAQAGDHHQHLCDQPEWLLVWSSRQEHGVITNWAELWSNTHLSVANFQEFPDVQGWYKISSPLTPSLSFFYFFHAALLWVLGAVILITHLFLTPCQCHIFYFSFHISQKQWPIDHSLSDISHFFSYSVLTRPPSPPTLAFTPCCCPIFGHKGSRILGISATGATSQEEETTKSWQKNLPSLAMGIQLSPQGNDWQQKQLKLSRLVGGRNGVIV